ncbi:MAG: hypothetical protein ACT6WE_06280, partial [Shinella sp.]|uniref:hypothetical protein n=2 Tax=Shinella sp. TaxID=1870904 RepID=UPI004035EA73
MSTDATEPGQHGVTALDDDEEGIMALMKLAVEAPKRDNTEYHHAIAEFRRAFAEADAALGPEVQVRTKGKWKQNGNYVLKMTFKRKASSD